MMEYFKWKLFVSRVNDTVFTTAVLRSDSPRDGIDTTESMSWWQSMLDVKSADSASANNREDIEVREGGCIVEG